MMYRATQGGLCHHCGAESNEALYWEPAPITLDLSEELGKIIEPDMTGPTLCDKCYQVWSIKKHFREDSSLAQRIYGAETAEDAIRQIRR